MSFREFLKYMEDLKEVIHIEEKVSPIFEISAIMKNLPSANPPIIFFNNVEGYGDASIVGNVCATRKRICASLGITEDRLYSEIIDAINNPEKPQITYDSPVKEVKEPGLSKIPILKHYERDAGPYITSAIVSAKSPDGSIENVSIHRLLVLDDRRLAIRLVPRHLFKLWSMAKASGKDLDVAIAIGVHPAILLAAASSPPFGVSEYWMANRLLKGRLKLIECEKVNAYAPAESEIILEGKLSCREEALEGPFVDITGAYDIPRYQPVVEIVNVMRREKYIYHALLPGGLEHMLLMGLPREAAIYDAVSRVVPRVKAVNLSIGGCGWLHAIISIDKQTDGDAKNALLAAFAAHPSLKHAIVVDTDVNVFNLEEVEWAIATRFQGDEDLLLIKNIRGSTLDPSADMETGLTTKIGIDATRPLKAGKERFERAAIPLTERAAKIIGSLRFRV
ncbi:MAG: UbiD family decarboxylase [Candidatus Bathyarchaeota archaeon]|nr:UbiD family decarboxylase [Candidatus Bathyarchaeota archaeon]